MNIVSIVLTLFGLLVILAVTGLSAGFRFLVKLDRDSKEESSGLAKSLTGAENLKSIKRRQD